MNECPYKLKLSYHPKYNNNVTNMGKEQAIAYATEKIPEILPLENQDVIDLCNEILRNNNNNPDAIAEAFLNFLGQEDLSFEFVFKFNELLASSTLQNKDIEEQQDSEQKSKPVPPPITKEEKPPVSFEKKLEMEQRKLSQEEIRVPKSSQPNTRKQKETLKPPQKKSNLSTSSKKTKSPKQLKLQSLEEIDNAVNFLSMTHEEQDISKYKCSCQGKRHPVFSIAPNCLSCGKIICVREGLHLNNCTFCNEEILPPTERIALIDALKEEEDSINGKNEKDIQEENNRENNRKPTKSYKISTGMGKNLFDQQDKLFDFIERQKERERKRDAVLKERDEVEKRRDAMEEKAKRDSSIDKDLRQAQERLENLLHFQETSAERTKVIDNASDFSMSDDAGLWGSARERALLLKKQQRNLRKWERLERERNGRRDKYVVSMDIRPDGKVVMNENVKEHGNVYAASDEESEDISDEEDLHDLSTIKDIKKDLLKEKEINNKTLQANIWNYKKDQQQYEDLQYIGDPDSSSDNESEKDTNRELKSRVQFNQTDGNSLEENILAVL